MAKVKKNKSRGQSFSEYTVADLLSPKKRAPRKRRGSLHPVVKTESFCTPLPKSKSFPSILKPNEAPGNLNERHLPSSISMENDIIITEVVSENRSLEVLSEVTSFALYLKPRKLYLKNPLADVTEPTNERESTLIFKDKSKDLSSYTSISGSKSPRSIKPRHLDLSTKEDQSKVEYEPPRSTSMDIARSAK